MTQSAKKYAKAPITEAIIEILVQNEFSTEKQQKLVDLFKDDYPNVQPRVEISVNFDERNQKITHDRTPIGFRLSSADETQRILILPNGIVFAVGAPYNDWDEFSARARAEYELWRSKTAKYEPSRIGIRYINRIDVPVDDDEGTVDINDYFEFTAKFPHIAGEVETKFLSTIDFECATPGWLARVTLLPQSPPPLVNHVSVLLDIDVYRRNDLPLKTDALWGVLNEGRNLKNDIFERSITDNARRLFE